MSIINYSQIEDTCTYIRNHNRFIIENKFWLVGTDMVKRGQAGCARLSRPFLMGCVEGAGHETAYGHVVPNALGLDLHIMRYIP